MELPNDHYHQGNPHDTGGTTPFWWWHPVACPTSQYKFYSHLATFSPNIHHLHLYPLHLHPPHLLWRDFQILGYLLAEHE